MDQVRFLGSAPSNSVADKPAIADKTVEPDIALPPFLPRKQLLRFLNAEGIPIGKSTLDKLCALGQGPPVAAYWGRLPLYRPVESLSWATARLRFVRGEQDDAQTFANSAQTQ